MIRACLVVFLVLVVGRGVSLAGGLRDFDDSWPIDSLTARMLLATPETGRISGHGLQVMAGQGRLFEMPELSQRFLAMKGNITGKTMAIKIAAQWERTGSGLFVADHLEGRVLLGQSPSWGIAAHWMRQTLGANPEDASLQWALLWELGLGFGDFKGRMHLEWPLKISADELGGRRRNNLLNLTLSNNEFAAALVVDRHDDGSPKAGFHLLLALDRGLGLEFRADPSTGSLGPGLTLVRGGLMLRTSHVIHPHLGVTHRLMLVVSKASGGV